VKEKTFFLHKKIRGKKIRDKERKKKEEKS
jgi:hypothetical protein